MILILQFSIKTANNSPKRLLLLLLLLLLLQHPHPRAKRQQPKHDQSSLGHSSMTPSQRIRRARCHHHRRTGRRGTRDTRNLLRLRRLWRPTTTTTSTRTSRTTTTTSLMPTLLRPALILGRTTHDDFIPLTQTLAELQEGLVIGGIAHSGAGQVPNSRYFALAALVQVPEAVVADRLDVADGAAGRGAVGEFQGAVWR